MMEVSTSYSIFYNHHGMESNISCHQALYYMTDWYFYLKETPAAGWIQDNTCQNCHWSFLPDPYNWTEWILKSHHRAIYNFLTMNVMLSQAW